jgi:paraquat-inducible protein B
MSDNSGNVAIGAFIIGAAIIAISAIIFVSGSGWGGDKSKVIMVFDGSVKGLSVGAPVALRGVEIGQVTDIRLVFDTDSIDIIMSVVAEIDSNSFETKGETEIYIGDKMIARGLRAQLNSQSLLTGLLYIQLDFHPDSELNLADIDSPYTQIPTIPTDLQRITRELESLDFAGIAKNVEAIAQSLGEFVSADSFKALPVGLHQALLSIQTLSSRLDGQIASSGPKLDTLLAGGSKAMATLNTEVSKLATNANIALLSLNSALVTFEDSMAEIENLVSDDSATIYGLKKALREISLAGRELQLLAKTLEEHPEVLIRGKSGDGK